MERSIEAIWKNGFMNKDALVVPMLNDLYNQKSQHLIGRLLRIMKIDLWTLIPITLLILAWFIYDGQFWVGISYLVICAVLFRVAWQKLQEFENIDYNVNCYQYLKSIDEWLKGAVRFYVRIIRYGTPIYLVLVVVLSLVTTQDKSIQEFMGELSFPEGLLVLTVPLAASIVAVSFYKLMYRVVYGTITNKITDMLRDMEELKTVERL